MDRKLHQDGMAITARGLICESSSGEEMAPFSLGHSSNAGSGRSGSFITTCLYRGVWWFIHSFSENVRAFQLQNSVGLISRWVELDHGE